MDGNVHLPSFVSWCSKNYPPRSCSATNPTTIYYAHSCSPVVQDLRDKNRWWGGRITFSHLLSKVIHQSHSAIQRLSSLRLNDTQYYSTQFLWSQDLKDTPMGHQHNEKEKECCTGGRWDQKLGWGCSWQFPKRAFLKDCRNIYLQILFTEFSRWSFGHTAKWAIIDTFSLLCMSPYKV